MAKGLFAIFIAMFLFTTPSISRAGSVSSSRLTFDCSGYLTSTKELSPGTRVFLIVTPEFRSRIDEVSRNATNAGMSEGMIENGIIRGILKSSDISVLSAIAGVKQVGIGVTVLLSDRFSVGIPKLKKQMLTKLKTAGFHVLENDSSLYFGYIFDLAKIKRLRSISGVDGLEITENYRNFDATLSAQPFIPREDAANPDRRLNPVVEEGVDSFRDESLDFITALLNQPMTLQYLAQHNAGQFYNGYRIRASSAVTRFFFQLWNPDNSGKATQLIITRSQRGEGEHLYFTYQSRFTTSTFRNILGGHLSLVESGFLNVLLEVADDFRKLASYGRTAVAVHLDANQNYNLVVTRQEGDVVMGQTTLHIQKVNDLDYKSELVDRL